MLEKIKRSFDKKGACVARAENVPMATTSGRDYDKVIDRLLKTKGATGVIVLLDSRQSRLLLEAANRKRTGPDFSSVTAKSSLFCAIQILSIVCESRTNNYTK